MQHLPKPTFRVKLSPHHAELGRVGGESRLTPAMAPRPLLFAVRDEDAQDGEATRSCYGSSKLYGINGEVYGIDGNVYGIDGEVYGSDWI